MDDFPDREKRLLKRLQKECPARFRSTEAKTTDARSTDAGAAGFIVLLYGMMLAKLSADGSGATSD
jgi:hypothetical protein